MKRLVFCLAMPLLLTNLAWGQDAPRVEVGLALGAKSESIDPFGTGYASAVNLGLNVNENWGFAVELSGSNSTLASVRTFTVGPRFTRRTKKYTAFAHAMFGSYELDRFDRSFGMVFGGGFDINLRNNKRVAIRVFQVDYISYRFSGGFISSTISLPPGRINDARILFGVTFKFGSLYE